MFDKQENCSLATRLIAVYDLEIFNADLLSELFVSVNIFEMIDPKKCQKWSSCFCLLST